MIADVGASVKVLPPPLKNTMAAPDAALMVPELNMLTPVELPRNAIVSEFGSDDEIVPVLMIEPEKWPREMIASKNGLWTGTPVGPVIRPALLMTPEKFPARKMAASGPFSEITPVLLLKMSPERVEAAPVNTIDDVTGKGAVVCELNKSVNGAGIGDIPRQRGRAQNNTRKRGVLVERAFVRDVSGDVKIGRVDARDRAQGGVVEPGRPR